jgi:acyl carrier protein
MTTTREVTIEIARKEAERAHVHANTDLDRPFRDVGLDSLDVMTIVLALQSRFGVELKDAELDAFTTLGQIADEIERRVTKPTGAGG